jgi:hypothetical protein
LLLERVMTQLKSRVIRLFISGETRCNHADDNGHCLAIGSLTFVAPSQKKRLQML